MTTSTSPVAAPSAQHFSLVLEGDADSDVTAIVLPFSVLEAFGSRARVPVRGTINGAPFRSSVFPQGDGTHYMVVNKEIRQRAGAKAGDVIEVVMERDNEPRTIMPPDDLVAALAENDAARMAWEKLSYTHQREHVQAIEEAKRPETRTRRIEKAIEMLTMPRK
jgi:hypothetical protein